ncbi:MAG: hypothetical protein AAGE52_02670 [Myxococcota bacterium]
MRLLKVVRTLFRSKGEFAEDLKRRGAGRELVRFCEDYGADILAAWTACPRGNWCIEIAARSGLNRGLVVHAADDLAKEGAPSAREVDGSGNLERFAAGGDLEEFCLYIEALCFSLVEATPTVRSARAAMEEARDWGRFQEMVAAGDAYDSAYLRAYADLARIVRRRIPAELVRTAFLGQPNHPYR